MPQQHPQQPDDVRSLEIVKDDLIDLQKFTESIAEKLNRHHMGEATKHLLSASGKIIKARLEYMNEMQFRELHPLEIHRAPRRRDAVKVIGSPARRAPKAAK